MLYLALYKLYISAFVEKNEVIEREMKEAVVEAITEVREYQMSNKDIIKLNHKNVLLSNSNINFESLIKEFDVACRIKAGVTRTILHCLRNFFCLSEHQESRTGNFICTVSIYFTFYYHQLRMHETRLSLKDA